MGKVVEQGTHTELMAKPDGDFQENDSKKWAEREARRQKTEVYSCTSEIGLTDTRTPFMHQLDSDRLCSLTRMLSVVVCDGICPVPI